MENVEHVTQRVQNQDKGTWTVTCTTCGWGYPAAYGSEAVLAMDLHQEFPSYSFGNLGVKRVEEV